MKFLNDNILLELPVIDKLGPKTYSGTSFTDYKEGIVVDPLGETELGNGASVLFPANAGNLVDPKLLDLDMTKSFCFVKKEYIVVIK